MGFSATELIVKHPEKLAEAFWFLCRQEKWSHSRGLLNDDELFRDGDQMLYVGAEPVPVDPTRRDAYLRAGFDTPIQNRLARSLQQGRVYAKLRSQSVTSGRSGVLEKFLKARGWEQVQANNGLPCWRPPLDHCVKCPHFLGCRLE